MPQYRHGDMLMEGSVTALQKVDLQDGATLSGDTTVQVGGRIILVDGAKLETYGGATLDGPIDVKLPAAAPAETDQGTSTVVIWLDAVGQRLVFQVRFADGTSRETSLDLNTGLGPVTPTAIVFGRVVKGKVGALNDKVAMPTTFGAYSRGYAS